MSYIVESLRTDLVECATILHTSVRVSGGGVHQVAREVVQGQIVHGRSLSSVGSLREGLVGGSHRP